MPWIWTSDYFPLNFPALKTGQSSCSSCKKCHQNASSSGTDCLPGSASDSVVCTCNAGFYGDGMNCSACKICSSNANTSRLCAGSESDTVTCRCNAGFYGDGLTCTICKSCALNGTTLTLCGEGSVTDVVTCGCNAGFYGDGIICTACKSCALNGTTLTFCGEGSVTDVVTCGCNSGFYGDGLICTACKVCGVHAITIDSCSAGGSSDTVECLCHAGYSGTGFICSLCPPGFFSLQGDVYHILMSNLHILNTLMELLACNSPIRVDLFGHLHWNIAHSQSWYFEACAKLIWTKLSMDRLCCETLVALYTFYFYIMNARYCCLMAASFNQVKMSARHARPAMRMPQHQGRDALLAVRLIQQSTVCAMRIFMETGSTVLHVQRVM